MDALSGEDYRRVLRGIEALAGADDFAGFPRRALTAVLAAIEVDFASFSEVDPRTGWNRFLIAPDLTEVGDTYVRFARRFANHPILASQLAADREHPELAGFVRRLRLLGMVGNCCGEAALMLNLELAPSRGVDSLAWQSTAEPATSTSMTQTYCVP